MLLTSFKWLLLFLVESAFEYLDLNNNNFELWHKLCDVLLQVVVCVTTFLTLNKYCNISSGYFDLCKHARTHACTHARTHSHACTHIHAHHMHIACVHTHACMHAFMHTCVHAHMHMHIHTYT